MINLFQLDNYASVTLKVPEATTINDKILMSFKILNIFFTIMNPRKEFYWEMLGRRPCRTALNTLSLNSFDVTIQIKPL